MVRIIELEVASCRVGVEKGWERGRRILELFFYVYLVVCF